MFNFFVWRFFRLKHTNVADFKKQGAPDFSFSENNFTEKKRKMKVVDKTKKLRILATIGKISNFNTKFASTKKKRFFFLFQESLNWTLRNFQKLFWKPNKVEQKKPSSYKRKNKATFFKWKKLLFFFVCVLGGSGVGGKWELSQVFWLKQKLFFFTSFFSPKWT